MSRRPLTDLEHAFIQAKYPPLLEDTRRGATFDFFDPPTGTRTSKSVPKKHRTRSWDRAFAACVERARECMSKGAPPIDAAGLVGLYAVLHEFVFDVLPLELKQEYGGAVSSAAKLVRDEFGGDYAEAERFVAWCWKRTRQSVKRKKADGDEPFRPGWRFQFKARSWLTDYKAAKR